MRHRVYHIDVDATAISVIDVFEVPAWRSDIYPVQPP